MNSRIPIYIFVRTKRWQKVVGVHDLKGCGLHFRGDGDLMWRSTVWISHFWSGVRRLIFATSARLGDGGAKETAAGARQSANSVVFSRVWRRGGRGSAVRRGGWRAITVVWVFAIRNHAVDTGNCDRPTKSVRPTHSNVGDDGGGWHARAWKRLDAYVRTPIYFINHLATSFPSDRTSTPPPRGSPGTLHPALRIILSSTFRALLYAPPPSDTSHGVGHVTRSYAAALVPSAAAAPAAAAVGCPAGACIVVAV